MFFILNDRQKRTSVGLGRRREEKRREEKRREEKRREETKKGPKAPFCEIFI